LLRLFIYGAPHRRMHHRPICFVKIDITFP